MHPPPTKTSPPLPPIPGFRTPEIHPAGILLHSQRNNGIRVHPHSVTARNQFGLALKAPTAYQTPLLSYYDDRQFGIGMKNIQAGGAA